MWWFPIRLRVPRPPPIERWGPCPLPLSPGRLVAECDGGAAEYLPRRVGEVHTASTLEP